ncbi:OTU domain-containing protein 4 isoform 1-T1 [Acanthopagrus schlegelii]
MDGGGSMQSNEERGAEKLMDDYLKSLGLHRKKIAKDGSCLFRAVAEQVLHCQSLHTEVRAKCVEFLKQNRETYEAFIEGDFENYLLKLQDPQQWVGEVEINALAVIYKRDFLIFQEPGKPAVNITDNSFKDKVQLCFLNGNHYDSVYPINHLKNTALCQSILYELLYDNVFKVDRSALTLCQRASRSNDLVSDDGMNPCASSDESDPDAGEPHWVQNGTTTNTRHTRGRGRGRQLPERVRRSLNPTLLRNIEYDVWQKSKRAQQKMDYCIAAGMQFTAGDRCQVRLEANGRSYNATVKEVPPNSSSVTVYIEELGRRQVPLWTLRPPKDENSWSTVVTRDKRLSNGHGEWEERGKGRGRGKYVPASSSVSQATEPGSSGRVQKQHSWPAQATVEEQGGGKGNRALKSVSSLESAFGITPELLKAKREEEMNVALVEIQLRDEDSFPALSAQSGLQGDGGKKKGGEKRRSQRNKTKSPVEDVRAPSPSAGERPKSSTPPPADAAAPPTNTTTPANPTSPPAAAPPVTSDSSPACLSSLKASLPNTNMSAATTTTAAAAPSCAAPTKSSTSSSAAGAPPAAAPSSKPPVKGGAVPPSVPSSACLFSVLSPPSLPAASSPPTAGVLSSPSPPPSSSASPPPSSSLPPPTFIAPIAPSPAEAQGILPRSSPSVSALRHSPSPPTTTSSSSSQLRQAAPDAPPVSAPTLNSLTNTGLTSAAPQTLQSRASLSQIPPQVSQTQTQSSRTQSESQTHPSLPPNQTTSLHQTQASVAHLQPQSQSQPEVTQVPSSQLPPVSTSVQPHPPVPHPHLHAPPPQPPHPSQVPHPYLSLSTSPPPSLQSQNTQNQTEASLPHTQPQLDSPPHLPPQQSHPSHHPHLQSALPPHPQSIPGTVPLQQLSQLYHDPLYPGFPQGEKGEVVLTPPMSSNKSGDDLPQDVNVLRFFFNLGVKSYSMPMFPPYIYLLPLQQAHTLHPKFPCRSPSPAPAPAPAPHFPAANQPPSHQEAYSQYPPTSAAVGLQYDHQAPLAEPAHPSDHSYNQAGYPVTQSPHQRMPCPSLSWPHHQMAPPRNPNFTVGYPAPSPPYPVHQPMPQGYHPGQGSGHPIYPASVSPYPPSSLGYQSSPAHEELQVSQGALEQRQPTNGDTVPGQGSRRVPGPSAANLANANNSRAVVVPNYEGAKVQNVSVPLLMGRSCFPSALTKEPGDGLTRAVLLVDPPLNPNNPILVPNPGVKDVPVSMTTMKTGSTPGSPIPYDIIPKTTFPGDNNPTRGYRGPQKLLPPNKMVSLGALEPGQVSYLSSAAMAEPLSVGCSTEDDWDEQPGYKPPPQSQRGQRRNPRGGGGGGRGRGGSDPGRASYRRRYGGDAGGGYGYIQYNSSHRGRGRERGY